jgi:hypothetical protein
MLSSRESRRCTFPRGSPSTNSREQGGVWKSPFNCAPEPLRTSGAAASKKTFDIAKPKGKANKGSIHTKTTQKDKWRQQEGCSHTYEAYTKEQPLGRRQQNERGGGEREELWWRRRRQGGTGSLTQSTHVGTHRHAQTHTLRASAGKHRGPNRRGPRQAGTHHTKAAHRHTGFARAP